MYQLRPPGQPWVDPRCVAGAGCKARRPRTELTGKVFDPTRLVEDLIGDLVEAVGVQGTISARRAPIG
jgi:hypothetical protein